MASNPKKTGIWADQKARRLGSAAGYSLVEVMASIMLLSIAIIPMVGMFDMGLNAATLGGNYDRARTLANENLEKAKSMEYTDAETTYDPAGHSEESCDEPTFDCAVTAYYVGDDLATSTTATSQMRLEVTVSWNGGDNSYTTTGLKSE